jgi:hypothetical protein
MNTPLRVEITEKAQTQISVASAWWAENRPAATGAIREELDRILGLVRVQPEIGTHQPRQWSSYLTGRPEHLGYRARPGIIRVSFGAISRSIAWLRRNTIEPKGISDRHGRVADVG